MADSNEWRFQEVERRLRVLEEKMDAAQFKLASLSGAALNKQESKDDTKAVWGWIAAVVAALFAAAAAWFKK